MIIIKMNARRKKQSGTPLIALNHNVPHPPIMTLNILVFVALAFLVTFSQARQHLHRAHDNDDALPAAQHSSLNQSEPVVGVISFDENYTWNEPNLDHVQPVNDITSSMRRRRQLKSINKKPVTSSMRRRRQLKSFNKKPVKSIQSSDGDIIDCVPINKQPAFDHPLLKDHIFQNFPSSFPTALGSTRQPKHRIRRPIAVPQTWHHNGSCPLGTVPLRQTSGQDLMRWAASTVSPSAAYGTKTHKPARRPSSAAPRNADGDPLSISINGDGSNNHEHAIAYIEGEEVYGASAVLSVWDPWVETSNEFSLSQIWILGGSFDNDLNSIEAGWQVSPELYGDGRPRLFIYWTTDGYEATGCYNLLCSGFVQTSNTVAIGAAIAPVSRVGSSQYQIEIMIWKDPRQGNWWMAFEGSHIVGYWPAELFSHLSDYAANMVEWGGEVVNSRPDGRHTGTQMGSGHFAEGGFGAASFFHSLQVVDANNNLQPMSNVQTLAENPNCYDIKSLQDQTWGSAFYFGGPGRNQLCL